MANFMKSRGILLLLPFLLLVIIPRLSCGHSHVTGGECVHHHDHDHDKPAALKLRYAAIATILVGSALGVLIPYFGRQCKVFEVESATILFPIKAFAAGVILATGWIHLMPCGMNKLGSPCLNPDPWHKFSWGGLFAMVAALGTFMVENLAGSYYRTANNLSEAHPTRRVEDEEANKSRDDDGKSADAKSLDGETLRHRVVSQVLEFGIITHSVIIGLAMGTSESPSHIKPLVGALTFHQFFEGMGLAGCFIQAKFNVKTIVIMAILFCITTPLGVAIGIGIATSYDAQSTTALLVEGILDALSAGILIYAALVDLLAVDFATSKMQSSGKLQFYSYVALLAGATAMSVIGKWA